MIDLADSQNQMNVTQEDIRACNDSMALVIKTRNNLNLTNIGTKEDVP